MVFAIHWHESAMDLHVFPIPIPPTASLPTPSLWVFPVHQPRRLVSCIQPGLVICFTLENIHVSMMFSQNIPPSPSPAESKSLFCTSVSLFLFCILGYRYHLSKFHIYALVYCNGLYLSGLLHSYFNHIERMKSITTQKDKPGKYQQNIVRYIQSESRSVESDSLWPHGLSPWNSPGQNTGVGSLSLL